MRNLELVQAHSLFTFMGRTTDGLGSFLQSSLAEQSYHVVKKFACVGVLTSPRRSVHAQTSTRAYARTHARPFRKTLMQSCLFSLPKPITNAKSITVAASLSVAVGQVRSFKVTSQSTGVRVPSKNRR